MGRRKIETIAKIEDKSSRNITYCKRKRGLIKKCIEMAKLCDQMVYLAMFDKNKQRLVLYQSDGDFSVPTLV